MISNRNSRAQSFRNERNIVEESIQKSENFAYNKKNEE